MYPRLQGGSFKKEKEDKNHTDRKSHLNSEYASPRGVKPTSLPPTVPPKATAVEGRSPEVLIDSGALGCSRPFPEDGGRAIIRRRKGGGAYGVSGEG